MHNDAIVVYRRTMNNAQLLQSTKSGDWYIQWDNYRPNQIWWILQITNKYIDRQECKHNQISFGTVVNRFHITIICSTDLSLMYQQTVKWGWKISKFNASLLSQWIAHLNINSNFSWIRQGVKHVEWSGSLEVTAFVRLTFLLIMVIIVLFWPRLHRTCSVHYHISISLCSYFVYCWIRYIIT